MKIIDGITLLKMIKDGTITKKTKRVSCIGDKVYVTEKIDGSNMVIFKKDDLLNILNKGSE